MKTLLWDNKRYIIMYSYPLRLRQKLRVSLHCGIRRHTEVHHSATSDEASHFLLSGSQIISDRDQCEAEGYTQEDTCVLSASSGIQADSNETHSGTGH